MRSTHGFVLLSLAIIFTLVKGNDSSLLDKNGKFTAFFFPPPGTCFPAADVAYLAISTSDRTFMDSQVLKYGIELKIFMNGNHATSITWSPLDVLESDEGLSHHIGLPGLLDGEYHVALELWLRTPTPVEIGTGSETYFSVDTSGGCLDAEDTRDDVEHTGDEGGADEEVFDPANRRAQHFGEPKTHSDASMRGAAGSLDAGGMVLVNLARGRRAWSSQGAAAAGGAARANDGSTMVPSPGGGSGGGEDGAWRARHAVAERAGEEGEPWWEVDLGEEAAVHVVDLWGARQR